jgi:uncharacterized protein (DUF433 family)
MPASAELTPREVAELAGVPKRVVEKAIEEKVLPVRTGRIATAAFGRSGATRRLLGIESVAYVSLMRRLNADVTLSLARKRKLAKTMRERGLSRLRSGTIELAPAVTANLQEIAGDALERTHRYLSARDAWLEGVPGIKGGLPVIKGTRMTVHSILARLVHGDSLEDIAAENPDLPREAFEAAVVFAKAHPLPGRPAKATPRAA